MRICDWSSDVCSSDLAEAGALVVGNPVRQGNRLPCRQNDEIGRGPERAPRLGAEDPDALTDPRLWHAFADLVDDAGAVIVRDDAAELFDFAAAARRLPSVRLHCCQVSPARTSSGSGRGIALSPLCREFPPAPGLSFQTPPLP